MKRIFRLCVLIPLLAACCDKDEPMKMYLHTQTSFNNDHVLVKLDNVTVYDKYVTTNQLLGLADVDSVMTSLASHELFVAVNDTNTATRTLTKMPLTYIGITYNPPGPLSMPPYGVFIQQSEQAFLYE